MSVQSSTLSNGLRVVTDRIPAAQSVVLGFWVGVGARHEPKAATGVAHLTEHMLFKGTEKRSSYALSRAIEDFGGTSNAYTTREETAYYARVLPEETERACDILADMLLNSQFAEKELKKERQVILQEIGRDKDTPEDYIYDLLHKAAYPKQTMGTPILGESATLAKMPREKICAYVGKHYHAGNIVLIAAGQIDHDAFCKLAEEYFAALPKKPRSKSEKAKIHAGENRLEKEIEQLHLMLSFPAPHLKARDTHVASLLALILGGSSSSRLFQKIREKKGLAYSVFASHMAFSDTGLFTLYAGTDPSCAKLLMSLLNQELLDTTTHITPAELRRAKAQARAEILMGQESVMRRAEILGHQILTFGHPLSLPKILDKIQDTNKEEIQGMAQNIFSKKPILASLGPGKELPFYDEILKDLA